MLAKRLTQRGIVFSESMAAVFSAGAAASAPPALAASTIKAASLLAARQAAGVVSVKFAALTEGVMKTMLLTKLKIATAVLLVVAAAGVGAGWLGYHGQAAEPNDTPKAPATSKQPEENATMNDLKKLQGTWIAVAAEKQGNQLPEDEVKTAELTLVIEGEKFTIMTTRGGKEGMKGTLKIDPSKKPRAIDLTAEVAGGRATTATGIYELAGDTLKLCYGKERPKEFKTQPEREADQRSYVFRRDKKKGEEK